MSTVIAPPDPQASGWRAFVTAIVNHEALGCVKTWRIWDRPNNPPEPGTGELIWCRVMPVAAAAEPRAGRGPGLARTYLAPLQVTFDLAVPGPDPCGLISLWGRLEAAIFPADPGARLAWWRKLGTHGIRDVRLIQRAAPAGVEDVNTAMVRGTGVVSLDFYLDI